MRTLIPAKMTQPGQVSANLTGQEPTQPTRKLTKRPNKTANKLAPMSTVPDDEKKNTPYGTSQAAQDDLKRSPG